MSSCVCAYMCRPWGSLGCWPQFAAHFLWDRVFIDHLCCTGWPVSSKHPLQSLPSQYGVLSLCHHRMFSESCCSNHPVSLPISKNAASSSIFFLLPILIRHSWNHFHQGHPRFCWLNLVPPFFFFSFCVSWEWSQSLCVQDRALPCSCPQSVSTPLRESHFFSLVPSLWGAWAQPKSPGGWGRPCLSLKRTTEHLPRGSLEMLHTKGDQPLQRTHNEEFKGAEYRAV